MKSFQNTSVTVEYRPAALNRKTNDCIIRANGWLNTRSVTEAVNAAMGSLGYRIETVKDKRGRVRERFVKGSTIVKTHASGGIRNGKRSVRFVFAS